MKILSVMVLAAMIATTNVPDETKPNEKTWKSIGEQRITAYCPICNDGSGYESSSGKQLEYGDCACSWLPIGTKLSIEGEIFTVADICGTNAIDIFIDTDADSCQCNLNEYKRVSIKQ